MAMTRYKIDVLLTYLFIYVRHKKSRIRIPFYRLNANSESEIRKELALDFISSSVTKVLIVLTVLI